MARLEFTAAARGHLAGLPADLGPHVAAMLRRLAADYRGCSHPTPAGLLPGMFYGTHFRSADGVATVKVFFKLGADGDVLHVRAVGCDIAERLPDWVLRPSEWSNEIVWPVVDV